MLAPQPLRETRNGVGFAEVERREQDLARAGPRRLAGGLERFARAAGDRDDAEAGGRELDRDPESETAARPGHHDVTHESVPACRPA